MSIKECWLVTADLFSSHFNPPGKRINCLRRLCPAKTAPMTLRRGHRSDGPGICQDPGTYPGPFPDLLGITEVIRQVLREDVAQVIAPQFYTGSHP